MNKLGGQNKLRFQEAILNFSRIQETLLLSNAINPPPVGIEASMTVVMNAYAENLLQQSHVNPVYMSKFLHLLGKYVDLDNNGWKPSLPFLINISNTLSKMIKQDAKNIGPKNSSRLLNILTRLQRQYDHVSMRNASEDVKVQLREFRLAILQLFSELPAAMEVPHSALHTDDLIIRNLEGILAIAENQNITLLGENAVQLKRNFEQVLWEKPSDNATEDKRNVRARISARLLILIKLISHGFYFYTEYEKIVLRLLKSEEIIHEGYDNLRHDAQIQRDLIDFEINFHDFSADSAVFAFEIWFANFHANDEQKNFAIVVGRGGGTLNENLVTMVDPISGQMVTVNPLKKACVDALLSLKTYYGFEFSYSSGLSLTAKHVNDGSFYIGMTSEGKETARLRNVAIQNRALLLSHRSISARSSDSRVSAVALLNTSVTNSPFITQGYRELPEFVPALLVTSASGTNFELSNLNNHKNDLK